MTFGERLKELRLAAGLTQAQLAERAGVSQVALSQWESGGRKGGPSVANLFPICDALGVECSAFKDITPVPDERPIPKRGRPAKQSPAPTEQVEKPAPAKRKKKS